MILLILPHVSFLPSYFILVISLDTAMPFDPTHHRLNPSFEEQKEEEEEEEEKRRKKKRVFMFICKGTVLKY